LRFPVVASLICSLGSNVACVGQIAGPGPSTGSPTGNGTGAAGSAPVARLEKLTASQFANSVHDLLGQDAPLGPVEPDNVVDGFAAVGASTVTVSPSGVGQYEAATGAATDYVFADTARVAAVLSCVPSGTSDTACITQALTAFGRRAFRRPLGDEETSRFVTLVTTIGNKTGSSVLVGLRPGVWAILQAPSFLYRVELGLPSAADGGRLKYTSFEMASRLASALWNSVPDDALLDAAARDALQTAGGVAEQARRMLSMPASRRAIVAFADDLYGVQHLAEASKDTVLFPKWTPTLRDAMREELEERVADVVLSQADFLSLYESRTTFVNDELARYYGLPPVTSGGFERAELPVDSPRVGLLGSGAILAGFALPQRTSPTERGKFIAENLLCTKIPPPPPGVPPLPAMADSSSTLRQRLEAHRAAAQCAVCHGVMDPLGFGLENFDSAAMYRTTDNGQPIDATGTVGGIAFNGLAQMASALRKQPVAGPCVVSKVYENALGRTPGEADGLALDALARSFAANNNRVDQLLVDLVSSEAFRFVQPSKL
jgi:Protein of unknown function (DUF1592)/Protein of unknown function (DUF1588)/Protein of unknown function (DUF1595)/Protein of unknown function (DUF1585)/Protein of unknown function (DUF1587)